MEVVERLVAMVPVAQAGPVEVADLRDPRDLRDLPRVVALLVHPEGPAQAACLERTVRVEQVGLAAAAD